MDPRDHGARLWDALVETCQHALTTDLPPDCHGARPRIAVTTSLEVLARAGSTGPPSGTTGAAITDDGLELTPAVVRRLACDADLIPIVLGTQRRGPGRRPHQPAGHPARSGGPWSAATAHCAFPGCTRPPVMCHAHHIVHWADGGTTALANLVLLCGHHHRVIHHTPWQVRLNPADGKPEFLRHRDAGAPPRPGSGPGPDASEVAATSEPGGAQSRERRG